MNVVIWGTGNFGNYINEQIKKNENIIIKYFIDRDTQKGGGI